MTDFQKPGTPTDRHQLGAAGMPLNTLADYRPIPADGYGALFLPDRIAKGYHVEEINDGAYYVTSGAYDTMFVRTGNGVVVVDAPPLLGENLKRAIAEVTDEPVTHLIYSHWHSDHIGAAGIFTADKPKVIAHDYTREMIQRWPDLGGERGLPLPTDTITESDTLDVNGVRFNLDYHGVNHTPGNIFIYAPSRRRWRRSTSSAPDGAPSSTVTPPRTSAAGPKPTTGSSVTTSRASSPATSTATAPPRTPRPPATTPTTSSNSPRKPSTRARSSSTSSGSASATPGSCGRTTSTR